MRIVHIITGAVIALAISGHGVGQTKPIEKPMGGKFQKDVPATLTYTGDAWFPLKCEKFQHVDSPPAFCGDQLTFDEDGKLHNACYVPRCVDDMHMVTEREWQELLSTQERLQGALNHLLSALDHQANFNDKIIHALERVAK